MRNRAVIALLTGAMLLTFEVSCRQRRKPPLSPAAVVRDLGAAARARDLRRLYALLDTESRWSLMSVHKDQLKLCGLVRSHYPKERQSRELLRCRLADGAPDAEALFIVWVQQRGLLARLGRLTGETRATVAGARASVESGGQRLELCREGEGWAYCGLREEREQLKLKAARDLASIQENVEAYRGR